MNSLFKNLSYSCILFIQISNYMCILCISCLFVYPSVTGIAVTPVILDLPPELLRSRLIFGLHKQQSQQMDRRLDSPLEGATRTTDVARLQIRCPAQQDKGPWPKKYPRGTEQTRKWPHLIQDPARGVGAFVALRLLSPSLHSSSCQLDVKCTSSHCLIFTCT